MHSIQTVIQFTFKFNKNLKHTKKRIIICSVNICKKTPIINVNNVIIK